MRHAFGDHIARYAGIKNAQALLGHADVGTTQIYTGAPTLDELAAAIKGIRFAVEAELTFYPLETHPANPLDDRFRIAAARRAGARRHKEGAEVRRC